MDDLDSAIDFLFQVLDHNNIKKGLIILTEKGPRNSGPTAYARTKIDNTRALSISEVIWRSAAIELKAGATIELLTGEMKVNEEITNVAAHLRPELQFLGLVGSSKDC